MDIKTNFIAGKMNKSVDERLIPKGQYIDALNVRLGSTEGTEIGAVENSKGNTKITNIQYRGTDLSSAAVCIGAYGDGVNENIYWFITDPKNPQSLSGKVDMIMSLNTTTEITKYHVVSETVLNFNFKYLITGVNLIEDLLFWTDDYNPPRKININSGYAPPIAGVDAITGNQIQVIVKPPGFSSYTDTFGVVTQELFAPKINLVNVIGDENFIVDKFLSFAYRYQYVENEYSATSLYTTPAFEPGIFDFNSDTFQNDGMSNIYNAVDVSFNTGNNQVIAIEVLFKESRSNSINVIERFNKSDLGWSDNTVESIRFSNSKIYSVLGQDELLRLYDNVPRFAKAQTIMGNRLVYGNYIDQYDVVTSSGRQIAIDYETSGNSVQIINDSITAKNLGQGASNIINPAQTIGANLSLATFDLEDSAITLPIPIRSEFLIRVQVTSLVSAPLLQRQALGGDTTNSDFPLGFETNGVTNQIVLQARFLTLQAYQTYNELLSSSEFAACIGTSATITPIAPGANYGFSLSDQFSKIITAPTQPQYQQDFTFTNTGKWSSTPAQQGFRLVVSGDTFKLQVPSVKYFYTDGIPGGVEINVYEYFGFTFNSITIPVPSPVTGASTDSSFTYSNVSNSSSLHSNRNYETSIMYMDSHGRSTTALVAPNNTVFFEAITSTDINTIKVLIRNKPPFWATKYKFFLKPSLADYNIIYSDSIFTDASDPSVSYVRLEGSATTTVSENDILTVKITSNGQPTDRYITTTALEIKALSEGDGGAESPLPTGAPAGLYMKIKPQGFSATTSPNAVVNNGFLEDIETNPSIPTLRFVPSLSYPLFTGETGATTNYDLPEGSTITMTMRGWRSRAFFATCDADIETSPVKFIKVATADYDNFYDFWTSEGLEIFNIMENAGCQDMVAKYYAPLPIGDKPSYVKNEFQFYFQSDDLNDPTSPMFLGLQSCVVAKNIQFDIRPSHVECKIVVNRNNNFMVFETQPAIADPNFFYESSEMYDISPDINGNLAHKGDSSPGSQDQIITGQTPAIVTLPFSDVYTFGNGVESYRYLDLPAEKSFILGERLTAVSNNLFKEADRFAGLTYSGVFSGSSNVNNLNEFNLGLVNFKDLELIFGPIMKLHSRETDILVLQEDKISYVLANKNLISDAQGGGAIVSTPTILGTQIARIEEYGISFNPESFTSWGSNMYFTDAKRGAVIKLTGSSSKNDSLEIISTYGMRSFFRNKFADQLTTQKLGAYDPYMDEYIFSSNNTSVPVTVEDVPCSTSLSKSNTTSPFSINVGVGTLIGLVNIDFNILAGGGNVNITTLWNGIQTVNNNINTNTVISFNKTSSFPKTFELTVTPNSVSNFTVVPQCVESQDIDIVLLVLGTPISGQTSPPQQIHFEYEWNDGLFFSPLISNLVNFSPNNNVSSYTINSGQVSQGGAPSSGSVVTMKTNKIFPDNYNFSILENRFYAITSTVAPVASGDLFDLSLLQPSNNAPLTPISNNNPLVFEATSPPITIGANDLTLYLVWDLRDRGSTQFCYSPVTADQACNGCSINQPCIGPQFYLMDPDFQTTQSLACNNGFGPNGTYTTNPSAYVGFYHTQPNGVAPSNEPAVGDIAYSACGSNPNACCLGGIVARQGFYFSRAQSVIEIGPFGEVLTVLLFPCN